VSRDLLGNVAPDNPHALAITWRMSARSCWLRTGVACRIWFAIGRSRSRFRSYESGGPSAKCRGYPSGSGWCDRYRHRSGVCWLKRYRRTRAQLEVGKFVPAASSSIRGHFTVVSARSGRVLGTFRLCTDPTSGESPQYVSRRRRGIKRTPLTLLLRNPPTIQPLPPSPGLPNRDPPARLARSQIALQLKNEPPFTDPQPPRRTNPTARFLANQPKPAAPGGRRPDPQPPRRNEPSRPGSSPNQPKPSHPSRSPAPTRNRHDETNQPARFLAQSAQAQPHPAGRPLDFLERRYSDTSAIVERPFLAAMPHSFGILARARNPPEGD